MNKHFLCFALFVSLCAWMSLDARAEDEASLIRILQSSAPAPEKGAACQKLRMAGTAQAVPALEALLADERLSHAARYALEGMPCAEAGAALRQALSITRGNLKAGVIDSIGWRQDAAAVSLLIPSLTSPDLVIASSTATALGRIGGQEAIAALSSALDQASPAVRQAIERGLLLGAERCLEQGNRSSATAVYRGLLDIKNPSQIRAAAWSGLVRSDQERRPELFIKALAGQDASIKTAALQLIRELGDSHVMQECMNQWSSLPAEAQLAVLDAQVKFRSGELTAVLAASASTDLSVRISAWQAMAELNDVIHLSALAKAATSSAPSEREAARDALIRLHGPGVNEAFSKQIQTAEPLVKAELLRALGDRDDKAASGLLLQHASYASEPVRRAALESLRKLAVPDTLPPLLDLAIRAPSEADRELVMKTLYAVCQSIGDKEKATREVLETLNRLSGSQRRPLLSVLPVLGTSSALQAAQASLRDQDPLVVKEAILALTQWPNAAPVQDLLRIVRSSNESTLQILALRGGIELAAQEPDEAKRLALLQQARSIARRAEEKKQALGQIGQIPTPEALAMALKDMTEPDLATEASLAAISIAEKLAQANPKLAQETAVKVLATSKSPEIVKRALTLRGKSFGSGPFIREWFLCGPFHQSEVSGAEALFNLPLGPEKAGASVSWKPIPSTDLVNLAALFPEQVNCVAYLKAQVTVADDVDAILLLGSDDGVKAWLNGAVVHGANVDRGLVADQDMAPIHLKKGANELMLKVTQGGGGWAACARIVGMDGRPIADR